VLHLSEHVAVHGATGTNLIFIIRVGIFASDVSHYDILFNTDAALLCSNNASCDE
jgi:hypothetical protein